MTFFDGHQVEIMSGKKESSYHDCNRIKDALDDRHILIYTEIFHQMTGYTCDHVSKKHLEQQDLLT